MEENQEERDRYNRQIAKESSWICEIFQDIDVCEKKKILKELTDEHKQKREKYAQENHV